MSPLSIPETGLEVLDGKGVFETRMKYQPLAFKKSWFVCQGFSLASARLLAYTILVCLSLFSTSTLAAITFSHAELIADSKSEEGTAYFLTADAAIELDDAVERGLASGVPIYFNAELEIHQIRKWWFDKRVHKSIIRFSLVYYELTRHYRVTMPGDARANNFRSLLDALEFIGSLRRMPIETDSQLVDGGNYSASIELLLDQNSLPLALRPVAFLSSAWRVESEAFHWLING